MKALIRGVESRTPAPFNINPTSKNKDEHHIMQRKKKRPVPGDTTLPNFCLGSNTLQELNIAKVHKLFQQEVGIEGFA